MKKVLSALLFVVFLLPTWKTEAQVVINAGYILQQHTFNLNIVGDELKQQDSWMNGGFIGVSQNLPMFSRLALAPGAYVSFSQAEGLAKGDDTAYTSDLSLKVPFYLNIKFEKIFVFGGPVFNVSLSTIRNLSSVANSSDIHFDMGATVGAGVMLGHFRLYAGYNCSLIDRENFDYTTVRAYTAAWEGGTFMVGAGYSL